MTRLHLPRSRSGRASILPSLILACGLLGCGSGSSVAEAEGALARGDVARVQQLLAGDESSAAQKVLQRASALLEQREAVDRRLAELKRDLTPLTAESTKALLREMLSEQEDPVAREKIEILMSRLTDMAAEYIASSNYEHTKASTLDRRRQDEEAEEELGGSELQRPIDRVVPGVSAGPRAVQPAATDGAPKSESDQSIDADLVRELREEILLAMKEREWVRGLAVIDMALESAGERASVFEDLRQTLSDLAHEEAVELVSSSSRLEEQNGIEEAREFLLVERGRFPDTGPLSIVHRELQDLAVREEILGSADAMDGPAVQPANAGEVAVEAGPPRIAGQASELLAKGRLEEARELWIEAGVQLPPGDRRDHCIGQAQDIEKRLLLFEEIAAARAADPRRFQDLSFGDCDRSGVEIRGEKRPWHELPLSTLKRAAGFSRLSSRAEVGLLLERGLRGEQRQALAELGRMAGNGDVDEYEAWGIVARMREEVLPPGGFVFESGEWLSRVELERRELFAKLEQIAEKVASAQGAEERAALLDEVTSFGPEAAAVLQPVLADRLAAVQKKLERGTTLDRLRDLANLRAELDRRRDDALALIFDEEEYFYPYNPPECPPDKAALYPGVQRRVDELINVVREVWDRELVVKLPGSFRAAAYELEWSRKVHEQLGLVFQRPDLPEWFEAIDVELDAVDLRTFAWDARELERLRTDRLVRALNGRRWAQSTGDGPSVPSVSEQRQVEITNDYRVMMGRRALAWNPKIQEAAQMHSDYMADTGDFGHFEPDPERRTPFHRMKLVGYNFGRGENCQMGGGDPMGAHVGWLHSSGHHRNILMPGHREMASALASRYWTQNFGSGNEFQEHLP